MGKMATGHTFLDGGTAWSARSHRLHFRIYFIALTLKAIPRHAYNIGQAADCAADLS